MGGGWRWLVYWVSQFSFALANMIAADAIHQGNPLQGVEDAMGAVNKSVQEFSNEFLARVKSQSKSEGASFKAQAASMKVRFQGLKEACIKADASHREAIMRGISMHASMWLRLLDELLTEFDELESLTLMAPREIRRSHAEWFRRLKAGAEDAEQIRESIIDLMEQFDPTPESYIDDELRKIHGDVSDSILRSFTHIAESDAFTLEAFKQRHNIR